MTPLVKAIVSSLNRSALGNTSKYNVDPSNYHWFDIDAAANGNWNIHENLKSSFRLPFPAVALAMAGSVPYFVVLSQVSPTSHAFDLVVPARNRLISGVMSLSSNNNTEYTMRDRVRNLHVESEDASWYAKMVQLARVTLFHVLNSERREAYTARKIAPKKGQMLSRPLYDWHTVALKPTSQKIEPQGGTHASPRPHDRRGHHRTLKSGKQVWVRNMRVGKGDGFIFKDYVVKLTS